MRTIANETPNTMLFLSILYVSLNYEMGYVWRLVKEELIILLEERVDNVIGCS